jgi:hypothetical protein
MARGGSIRDYTIKSSQQQGHWTLEVGFATFGLIDTGSAALSNGAEPGDQTVAFSGTAPTPGQWYFLRDTKKKETNASFPTVSRGIGGELVQVRSVSGSNVTFTAPLTQSYPAPDTDYDPRLSLLPSGVTVVENVLIKGFNFVGRTENGFNSWLRAGFCAGITLQDCSGEKSRLAGFSINYSRDVEVLRCTARDLITGAGTGSSYSIHLERCINAKVLQSKVINARYGVSIESGTSAWSVDGFFADGTTDGAVDIHGGDSYNGSVSNVSASGWPVSVGNTEWRRGASFVTYSAINCADLRLAAAIRDSSFEGIHCNRIRIETTQDDPNPAAPLGIPIADTFLACNVHCTTTDNAAAIRFYANSGTQMYFSDMYFVGCSITQLDTAARAIIINNPWNDASLTLDGCMIECTGTNAMIQIGGSGMTSPATCYALNSEFVAPSSAKVAAGGGSAYATFYNNTNGNTTPNYRGTSFPASTALTSSMVDSNVDWYSD